MILLGCLSLWSCKRDSDPREEAQKQVEALRIDAQMTDAEFRTTLDMVQHPSQSPDGDAQPRLQGALANKVFTLAYQNHATITIGGAAYDRPISQWLSGASAGNVAISPTTFAQLNAALSHSVRVVIGDNPYPWFTGFALRSISFTLLDKGNQLFEGLYDVNTREYLFLGSGGSVGGPIGTTTCGAISLGRIHGYMNPGINLTNGVITNGFIAACDLPILLTAGIDFYFDGTANP
jgi:hypothetical protein